MKSVLRYIGMKDIDLSKYGLNNESVYCEPFSGSFNAGFKLIEQGYKGKLIYNDIDEKVVNFWICMRENSNELLNRCNQLNNIIKNYFTDLEREKTLDSWHDSNDKFKRAAAEFVYRQYLTMKGLTWSVKENIVDALDFYLFECETKNIEINNLDYKEIISRYDSNNTFFLIDPPYDIDRVSRYYRGNCKEFNHDELADIISNINGKWLLTYNDNEHIRELYKNFKIKEVTRDLLGRQYTELYITKE